MSQAPVPRPTAIAARAKLTGVVIVASAIVANFMGMPYQTGWALILIGIDVLALWSLLGGRDGSLV